MDSLVELFCDVDDFCQIFEPYWNRQLLQSGLRKRRRRRRLGLSEIMTILIHFHQSHYRNFKAFYLLHVQRSLKSDFPGLVSYQRFVEYIPSAFAPLMVYLKTRCLGTCTGVSYIDSTPLKVCHTLRIRRHKVFAGLAKRGHSSTGWFYGFKLHLICNDRGELLNLTITPGNVDDRRPVPNLVQDLFGKLFGDRGYISQKLMRQLWQDHDLHLITKLRKNMQNRLMLLSDKLLLRKRAIIETIIDQLKNISQIDHSRHRSVVNYFVNVLCGLIAYSHQPKKPSRGLDQLAILPA